MDTFRRTLAFVVGILLVLTGIMDECPRIGTVVTGLLLMGVFTVPEAIGIIRGTSARKEDK